MTIVSEGDDMPVSLTECEPYEPQSDAVRNEVEAKMVAVVKGGVAVYPSKEDDTPTPPSWTQGDLIRAVGGDRKDRTSRQAIKHLSRWASFTAPGDGQRLHPADTLFEEDE
jgi:hypothetical protein